MREEILARRCPCHRIEEERTLWTCENDALGELHDGALASVDLRAPDRLQRRYWRMVDDLGINIFSTAPTALRGGEEVVGEAVAGQQGLRGSLRR